MLWCAVEAISRSLTSSQGKEERTRGRECHVSLIVYRLGVGKRASTALAWDEKCSTRSRFAIAQHDLSGVVRWSGEST